MRPGLQLPPRLLSTGLQWYFGVEGAPQPRVDLQAESPDWLDSLPASPQESPIAEGLAAICEYDFGDLEALEPPRGFGRVERGGHDAN